MIKNKKTLTDEQIEESFLSLLKKCTTKIEVYILERALQDSIWMRALVNDNTINGLKKQIVFINKTIEQDAEHEAEKENC